MKALTVILIIVMLLSPAAVFVSCSDENEDGETPVNASYDLNVTVSESENEISVDQTAVITNRFCESTDELVFAFYPDAFTLRNPLPVDDYVLPDAYPYGVNAGGYSFLFADGDDVCGVSICDTPCKIVVRLDEPLLSGESTTVRFSFDLRLPLCNARYGYNDFSVNLTFFFPVLCRCREDGNYSFYDYIPTGDPFVFDCADYSLSLNCPETWQTVCSAPEVSRENGVRRFEAQALRDLSLFLAPDAQIASVSRGDFTVSVMHDGSFGYAAEYALDALELFSDCFAPLPYGNYALVFTPFLTAGAEFCNVAVLSSSLSFAETEKTVAHEAAHQWWYSLVGSDQVVSPWQDEALAQWSTLLYFEKRGMKDYADVLLADMSRVCEDYAETMLSLGERAINDVFRKTTEYRDFTDYYVTVYCKAALATELTAQSVTYDGFCKVLSAYARENYLSFASQEALFSAADQCSQGTGAFLRSCLSATPYR